MPGATPGGLPYPYANEAVREGAAAIQALAEATEIRAPKKIAVLVGGWTTNQYGDIRIPAGPISVVEGAVGAYLGGVAILVVTSPQGASAPDSVGFSFFNSNGEKIADTFIILNAWVWGR